MEKIVLPLVPRLQWVSDAESLAVWFRDVLITDTKEVFEQLEAGGLTRGLSLTLIAEPQH